MRLVLTIVAGALLIAALWIATTNGRRNYEHPPAHYQDWRVLRGWALVFILLSGAFFLLAWFWPELNP